MVTRVAITTSEFLSSDSRAKKAALLFDRFVVAGLSSLRDKGGGWIERTRDFPGWEARFDWMLEQGLLYDERIKYQESHGFVRANIEYLSHFDSAGQIWSIDELGDRVERGMPVSPSRQFFIANQRNIATLFRLKPDCVATVLGYADDQRTFDYAPVVEIGRELAIHVVMNELPEPRDETPWEDIFSFRQDPDARAALARLRTWMATLATEATTPAGIEDELTALLADYKAHMRLHHIRTERSVLEAFLTTTAEVAQAIVTMKWAAAVKSVFDVSRAEIALLEAEMDAPGRVVAYIAHAQERFS